MDRKANLGQRPLMPSFRAAHDAPAHKKGAISEDRSFS